MGASVEDISAEADRGHQRTVGSGRRFIKEGPEDEKSIHLVTILTMASSVFVAYS